MQLTPPLRLALALLLASPAVAQTAGSPVIDRPLNDSSTGLTLIYRGPTQPLAGPSAATNWSFFDNETSNGSKVTPMIFQVTGANQWKLVAIGTPRTSTGAGVQTHPFATQAGTTTLQPGKQYTIGFAHQDYTFAGGAATPGASYGGVVDFTGYSVFSDLWSYITETTNVGTLVGTGGLLLDGQGFSGRIYSVSMSFVPISCGAKTYCTAKVSSNQCVPSIGFSGTPSYSAAGGFSITTSQLESGVSAIDFFGTNGQAATPFQGGLLCAASPIFRLSGKSTGGSGTCSGSVSYTLENIKNHPAGGPLVTAGGLVNVQTWSRDLGDPFGSNLSNALEILVCP
jgi:hypothetical protein